MQNELLYQIALTLVPNIGDVIAKALINHFGDAWIIFSASKKELHAIEGLASKAVDSILKFKDFTRAEEEVAVIKKYK